MRHPNKDAHRRQEAAILAQDGPSDGRAPALDTSKFFGSPSRKSVPEGERGAVRGSGVHYGVQAGRCALPSSADLAERPSCCSQQSRALTREKAKFFDSGPFRENG
jgi:hypothetical protein